MTRVIEGDSFPLEAISLQSAREKSLRRGHISTMHMWWARRPLVMARAVTLGLLLKDEHGRREVDLALIERLANFDRSLDMGLLSEARERLAESFGGRAPRVLDPFAGGGAIPLEALRLGCSVDAVDLNPVAYLLQRCALDFPIRHFERGDWNEPSRLVQLVQHGATRLREIGATRFGTCFPRRAGFPSPNAYIWFRTMQCDNPSCGAEIPLMSSRWLDNNKGRRRAFNVVVSSGRIEVRIADEAAIEGDPNEGTVRKLTVTCPVCATTMDRDALRRYGQTVRYGARLGAVIEPGDRRLVFREPTADDFTAVEQASELLQELEPTDGLTAWPDEDIPYSNLQVPFVYGFTNWSLYFNDRQKLVLSTLAAGVREVYDELIADGCSPDLASAVATYLGLIVDRIVDRNSSFSSWTAGRQLIRNTFARQGISNVWDYCEVNPLGSGSGSWDQAVEWVVRVIEHCETTSDQPARVHRGDAMRLPFPDDTFDAVITDPPYYDSVQYGDLSDFFYVWLKRSVGFLYPAEFSTPLTPKSTEIVSKRLGRGREGAVPAEEYERRMSSALHEMRRVVRDDGVAAIVFAHTTTAAWETLVRSLVETGWSVTASWPITTEMAARSRAIGQPSLASSVCLVCRPTDHVEVGFYDDVRRSLESRVRERVTAYWNAGLSGADLFIAAIGPAIEVFGRYKDVQRLDGTQVTIAELLDLTQQTVADFTLTHLIDQTAVGAIDDLTRFYVLWRWSYGTQAVPADDAYKLAQVFGVEIDAFRGRGTLIHKVGDKVSLRGPHERKDLRGMGGAAAASEALITTAHRAMLLWNDGAASELARLLGESGASNDPAFWSVVQSLGEIVPDGDTERMYAQGLGGNRARLSQIQPGPSGQVAMEFD